MYSMKCFDIADRQTRHSIYINSQKTHKKSADTVSDLNGSLDNWLWFRRDGPMLAHLSIFWKKYSPSGLDLARSEPVYIWHSFLRIYLCSKGTNKAPLLRRLYHQSAEYINTTKVPSFSEYIMENTFRIGKTSMHTYILPYAFPFSISVHA